MGDRGIYPHPQSGGLTSPPPPHPTVPADDPPPPRLGSYDVKEREIQSLLQWIPGFEVSQVYSIWEHPMGFTLFSTAQSAIAAKDALQVLRRCVDQKMMFDEKMKKVLHRERT
ncbi:hypothetical protein QJS10_CPA02g01436 [Acorus calamus]|uniref:Uncharacterized protein n=1 Tax=Acorus calamus TaxID=4465 RepID=A0AAV9FBP7_ACOCL|nr:hypothetical protein QJS10_CPA02g01436 [Acorus calamus]